MEGARCTHRHRIGPSNSRCRKDPVRPEAQSEQNFRLVMYEGVALEIMALVILKLLSVTIQVVICNVASACAIALFAKTGAT